jgi:hypothetical protein
MKLFAFKTLWLIAPECKKIKIIWQQFKNKHEMVDCRHFLLISKELIRVARWFIFKPRIPILGKFLRALDRKILIYFMAVWNTLRTFGISYDFLVHFLFIGYIFPVLG